MLRQVVLKFHPNQANPARLGGRGVWRVLGMVNVHPALAEPLVRVVDQVPFAGRKTLRVLTTKAYKARSRVDPTKIALDFPVIA